MRCVRNCLLLCLMCIAWALCCPITVGARTRDPVLRMEVGEPGQQKGSFAVGQPHSWYLYCQFPEAADGEACTLIQTLSPALSLEEGSITMELNYANGDTLPMQMGQDFDLTSGQVFVENGVSDRFSIALTQQGSAWIKPGAQLRVTYTARINSTALPGMQILGSAQLNCIDRDGRRTIYLSDRACVYTGGMTILLTDQNNLPMEGGKFMLAREATREEAGNPAVLTELLDTGEKTIVAVYENFYSDKQFSGPKTDIAVTDKRGRALFWGIPFGTYYLVQIEADQGLVLPEPPLCVRVNEGTHLTAEDGWMDADGRITDQTIRIVSSGILLPKTGGPGLGSYKAFGWLVILSACLLLWMNRKKRSYV